MSEETVKGIVAAATGAAFQWMESIGTTSAPGDLRNHAGTASGAVAGVQGFYQPGDGGGGMFYWVPSVFADDGGTKIPGPPLPVPPNTPSGYWQRLFVDELNVKWFGAVANGTSASARANNDLAFEAAIKLRDPTVLVGSFLWPMGIFVPPGDYYLGNDVLIRRPVKLFGAAMRGASKLWFAPGKGMRIERETLVLRAICISCQERTPRSAICNY